MSTGEFLECSIGTSKLGDCLSFPKEDGTGTTLSFDWKIFGYSKMISAVCFRSLLPGRFDLHKTEKSEPDLQLLKLTTIVQESPCNSWIKQIGKGRAWTFGLAMVHESHTDLVSYEYVIHKGHEYSRFSTKLLIKVFLFVFYDYFSYFWYKNAIAVQLRYWNSQPDI